MRQRIMVLISLEDSRRRDSLLRSAWLKITEGFRSKPDPKSAWYETSTGDYTPWKRTIDPIRCAIIAAVQSGDKQLIEQTLEGARAFTRELEADFASLVPTTNEEGLITVALDETHLEGEANEVQAQLIASPSPTNADRAVPALERQRLRLGQLIDCCRRAARETSPSLARSVR